MKKLLAAGVGAILMLSGCTNGLPSTTPEQDVETIIKFDGELKYFDSYNGNINNFFKKGTEPTQQAFTDNDVTVAVSEDGGNKRYRVMLRTSMTERPVLILDEAKAASKKCDFEAALALSYWDIDMNIVSQSFENAAEGSFFAANQDSTAIYMFTPAEEGEGGNYQAAFLNKKNVLLSVQSGTYEGTVDKEGTKLPKLNVNFSTTLVGNDTTTLPVKVSQDAWKEIAVSVQELEPKGDEVNFYGLTSGGDILEATYKNDSCTTKAVE